MQDRLQEQIDEIAQRDRRYPADAYVLVFEGLECALARISARRHVTPDELVLGVREAALNQWGLLARAVLESWSICETGAVGDLVFNLIKHGLLEAGEDDTPEQFVGVFSYDDGFHDGFESLLADDPPRLAARGA